MRTRLLGLLMVVSACSAEDLQTATSSDELTVSAIPRGSVWKYWDKGTDLGTSWRGDFDDASWSTGAGPLGFGETYVATTVAKGPITTYFRRTFTIDDPAAITAMTGELMFDDGVVVYLNGLEIGREVMPAGTITATTQSSGHEANNTYQSFDWTHHIDILRAGTNVIAVEVHQAGTASSDLVFDLSVSVETADGPPPPPSGDDIPRRSSWWYWDDGGDLGATWRGLAGAQPGWTSGAGPLGFGETYVATTVSKGPITTYFRREITIDDPAAVSAIHGELMYDDGAVVYVNGTEIARVAMPAGAITASTQSSGHEANNAYQSFDWSARKNLLRAGVNVIAVEVHQAGTTSSDLVFDLSLTVDTAAPPPPPEELGGFDRRSDWWYWDLGGEPEPGWKDDWYPEGPWKAGFGPFGYGETYLQTVISYGTDPSHKHISSYFKEYFNLYNPSAVTQMIAEVMYDDGVVVYLNGTEILRAGMPSGTITSTTLALGHEAENAYVTFDVSAYRNLLHQGFNWIDVEVHQQSASSSDLVFDMGFRLLGEQAPPPSAEEDIARGSQWAYWDRVESPSEYDVWNQTDYNDAQWSRGPGPLGYGDPGLRTTLSYGSDPANKPMTAYFRRWFTVDAPSAQTQMLLELLYDDGIVVHLNGNEIVRRNMGTGWDINHNTPAATSHEATTYETIDISDTVGYLRRGPNLLSIEVHQQNPASSDLAFDASLQIDTPAVCGFPGGAAVPPLPANGVSDVWVAPGTTFAAIGDTIGRRSSSGDWCWARPFADQPWGSIWGTADDDVWFAGPAGHVMHYDGASFAMVDVGTTEDLHGIWGSAPDDIWVIGPRGTVRHFDGTAWSARNVGADQDLYTVWGLSRDEVWIGGTEPAPYPGDPNYDGSSGLVFRWAPATSTWDLVLKNTMYYGSSAIWGLDGTSANDIWAIGSDHPAGAACGISGMWHFDGTAWSQLSNAPTECADLYDVDAGAPGATDGTWVVGWWEDGPEGAWRYTGGAWSAFPSPAIMTAMDHRDDRMFAGGWSYAPRRSHFLLRWDGSTFVQEW
jgi:hypothetical protein